MNSFNSSLKLVETKGKKSVFSKVKLNKNLPIYEFTGSLVTLDEITDHSYYLQISPISYMGPSGDYDDYINHSCNPNCYIHIVGNRAFLYTLNVILPNTEITFDYSLTSSLSKDIWNMSCTCNHFLCRKEISGYQYLPKDLKLKYEKLNIVPGYNKGK